MKEIWFFVFYTIANLFKRMDKKDDLFLFRGYALFSGCLLLNALSVLFVVEIKSGLVVRPQLVYFIGAPIFWLNYNWLLKNGKGKEIFERYHNEAITNTPNPLKTVCVWIYAILSFAITLFLALVLRNRIPDEQLL